MILEKSGGKRLWWCDPGLGRWKKWTKTARKVKVKKYQDATLAWKDMSWSFLIKKQIREAEKQSVVGISRMNWIAWLVSEISSRMKNDLQTYSDQMKYCDHCLVCTSLLNVNGNLISFGKWRRCFKQASCGVELGRGLQCKFEMNYCFEKEGEKKTRMLNSCHSSVFEEKFDGKDGSPWLVQWDQPWQGMNDFNYDFSCY